MDDGSVARLAAAQHALVTWDQARALGVTPQAIRGRVAAGRWDHLHLGVYRVAGSPETYEQALLAACLAVGPLVAASHRSAAVLHGLLSFTERPVEITTTRGRSPELQSVVVHRLADLVAPWVDTVQGVPCTTPARTLVDLGAVCRPFTVGAALDRALGRRMVTVDAVRTVMRAVGRRGRRGVGVMRAVLASRPDDAPAGVLEARMASLLGAAGLPAPVAEYEVRDGLGNVIARVDFAYPDAKLAIEVDGFEPHTELETFQRDRVRQNELVALKWSVLRFTWTEVDKQSPRVAKVVGAHLRRLRSGS